MKIAIIGAGITGLTLGYYLSKAKKEVTIFEKDNFVGGLASSLKLGDWYLERFYHHIFKSDKAIQELAQELGLRNIWLWKDCGAPIYHQGKIYPFSSALDLLNFFPISLADRLRTGVSSLYLKARQNYHGFENIKASNWLPKYMGRQSWQVVWQPLMKKKFGNDYKDIPMTWLWARINRRSRCLGYPKGGFQILIDRLVEKIKKEKGKIILNKPINNVNQLKLFDKIIFTGASPLLLKIAPQLPASYQKKLRKTKYLRAITVLLLLKKPITNWVYWLNVNDLEIPFLILIQQSNFINNKYYNYLHPVYLSTYTKIAKKISKDFKKNIFKTWIKKLNKINPCFKQTWIRKWYFFTEPYTQPVFTVKDRNLPNYQTPLKKVFLVNMNQIYPWDRAVNFAVELAHDFMNNNLIYS